MKKSLLAILVVLATVIGADARSLSPEQALNRAIGERTQSRAVGGVKSQPILTLKDAGTPLVYVFENNSDEGFIVVSADDIAAPVLGYSDTGKLDPANIPSNVSWWLDQYKGEIAAAIEAGYDVAYSPAPKSRASRAAIAPLCTTRWDQDAPYNNKCPLVRNSRAMTGCVATAMAQVLKYHNWPEKGKGKYQYNQSSATPSTISFDYANTTFDWKNMLDTYTTSASTAQINAVATLMYACGVSVEMSYGAQESGAVSAMVTPALIDYFNYDCGLHSENRISYSSTVWEDMVYNELSQNGPVYYAGQGNDGGHAFVCDGYNGDGYYHFNWGWSGLSDGYYRLSALDPDSQGIGGNTSGFNFDQMVILGVKKPVTGSTYAAPNISYVDPVSVSVSGSTVYLLGSFYNFSSKAYNGSLVIELVNDATSETKSITLVSNTIWAVGTGYSRVGINVSSLDDGTYKGRLYFVTDGNKYPVRMPDSQLGYITISKNGNSVTGDAPSGANLSIKDLKFTSEVYWLNEFKFTATAVNNGTKDANLPVVPLLLKSDDINDACAYGETMSVQVPAGGSEQLNFLGTFTHTLNGFSFTPGAYYFCLAVEETTYSGGSVRTSYKAVSPTVPVTVRQNVGTPVVSIASWGIEGSANAVDPYDLVVNATVKGVSGYYTNSIILYIFLPTGGQSLAYAMSEPLFVGAGDTKDITIHLNLVEAGLSNTVGTKYMCALYDLVADNWFACTPSQIVFTIGTSGIEDISADEIRSVSVNPNPTVDYTTVTAPEDITDIQLVSMAGALVTPSVDVNGAEAVIEVGSLPAGIYIARISTANGVYTAKVVKK